MTVSPLASDRRPEPEPPPRDAPGPSEVRSAALGVLVVLACLYTLYFARGFLLPVVLACLLALLLAPAVRGLKRLRIPEGIGALLVLAVVVGTIGLALYQLTGPALEWLDRAPGSMRRVEQRLRQLKAPVEKVSEATERVERMARVEPGAAPREVEVAGEGLGARLFQNVWDFSADTVVMSILLYFLLASGDLFLRKLVRVLPTRADRQRAVEIAREVQSEVSAYLSTMTLINLCLGAAVGLAFHFLGMPNPALWGVMVALLNFIPYLGPLVGVATISVAAFLTFPEAGRALLVPAAYFALNFVESYFVTPLVLGRRLMLNPVVIFVGLTFWGWLWGVVGALIAVPLLVVLKIFCDRSERLAPLGEFLGS
jgi:predicted PurR-regulated permease PerM